MTATAITVPRKHRRTKSAEEVRLSRVRWTWGLLFLNCLTYTTGGILPLPHKVGQVITQGALVGALVLALSVNPRLRIRPNVFLTLYSVLAITSLAMSVRFVSVGTTYRAFRLIGFLVVLWLLTPWFGRRDLLLVKTHLRILGIVLVSVVLGLMISPGKALAINYGTHRLDGALWPIDATELAALMANLTALAIILWMSGLLRPRLALLAIVPGFAAFLGTHTRTALVGLVLGLLVAALSLFTSRRRVRRTMLTIALVGVIVVVPLFGFVSAWLIRGQSAASLQDLSGRTKIWPAVLSEPKPETNKILGSGLSNASVNGALNPALDGLPIDSGFITTYQDQGIVGLVLEGAMFLVLLVTALLRPRGPTRAMALYLTIYVLIASFAQTGLGDVSTYLLDLTLASSLLMPPWGSEPRPASRYGAGRHGAASDAEMGWMSRTRSLFRS